MRLLLAAVLLLASFPALAQDEPDADENKTENRSVNGVGAKTTYEEAKVNTGPSSAEEAVPEMQPMRTLTGAGAPKDAPARQFVPLAAATAGGIAAGGGVTCGIPAGGGNRKCEITATSPVHFAVSESLAGMSAHMGAHGGMNFGPDNGYSVGFYSPANVDILDAPPFPNQGCPLALWISAKPGGPPLGGFTFEQAVAAGCAGYASPAGMLTVTPTQGCKIPEGVRYYLNVQANMGPYTPNAEPWFGNVPDMNGKFGWRQRICGEIISSPLGANPPGWKPPSQSASSGPAAPPRPACNVCAYADRSTGSCISCNMSPVNCNVCPAGVPGPGK